MARNKVSRALTIEREKIVWEMRIRGATYERIAKEVGITFGGVSKILERLHKRYQQKNMDSIEKTKLEQIGAINHAADEAIQGWERSKIGKDQHGDEIELPGEPKHLGIYLKALEDIRKIVGADSPIKSDNNSTVKVEVHRRDAEDELNKIYSNIKEGK